MDLAVLSARQGHVCISRVLVLYRLDLTDHNSVTRMSSQEVSGGGYRRIMLRYVIGFAFKFETSMPNLI
jgi:hypothetical protein